MSRLPRKADALVRLIAIFRDFRRDLPDAAFRTFRTRVTNKRDEFFQEINDLEATIRDTNATNQERIEALDRLVEISVKGN